MQLLRFRFENAHFSVFFYFAEKFLVGVGTSEDVQKVSFDKFDSFSDVRALGKHLLDHFRTTFLLVQGKGHNFANIEDPFTHVEVFLHERRLLFDCDVLQLQAEQFQLLVILELGVAVHLHVVDLPLEQQIQVLQLHPVQTDLVLHVEFALADRGVEHVHCRLEVHEAVDLIDAAVDERSSSLHFEIMNGDNVHV